MERVPWWDDHMRQRMKVLVHASPLFDLKRSDSFRDGIYQHYHALPLAMKVIDIVIENMGLPTPVTREFITRELEPLLCAMDDANGVAPSAGQHEAMAGKVLSALLNARGQYRHDIDYGDFEPNGQSLMRHAGFKLIEERYVANDVISVRASDPLIHIYLKALDRDIEDEQAAAEAVVKAQIDRGKFAEAERSAHEAKIRSIMYQTKIRAIVKDTAQHYARHDWHDDVPRELRIAEGHIKGRLAAERATINAAKEWVAKLPEGDAGSTALRRVIQLTRECVNVHSDLQNELMRARPIFLDAQGRQGYRPRPAAIFPNIHEDVLLPTMRARAPDARQVAVASFPLFLGSAPRAPFNLRQLMGRLLAPKRVYSDEGRIAEAPDLGEPPEDDRLFTPVILAEASAYIDAIEESILLSELLARAHPQASGATLRYITLWAYHALAPNEEDAADFDVQFAPGRFRIAGIEGDDLLIRPKEGAA